MSAPRQRSRTLSEWLAWQEQLHPQGIALGLDRVAAVWRRLRGGAVAPLTLTVAGTNGKGSSVALLDALLRAQGRRTASYTSPHLLRYNERIVIAGQPVGDSALCAAFERVEQARAETPLTYFEFGTLAALDLIAGATIDVAILEVGLGGRLDAVNILPADAALITAIDLDHQDYLGTDREAIGAEKAGILRPDCIAVSGDPDTPRSVRAAARQRGSRYFERGRDFDLVDAGAGWHWVGPQRRIADLPEPGLPGLFQRDNAAACLMLLAALELLPSDEGVRRTLSSVQLTGRVQKIGDSPERYVDVGHNPAAARALALWLASQRFTGRKIHAVVGMLRDKDHAGYLEALTPQVDHWHLAPTPGPRGAPAAVLRAALETPAPVTDYTSLEQAWAAAVQDCGRDDLIIACGSFLTVEAVLGRIRDS